MTYGSPIWHTPLETKKYLIRLTNKSTVRVISGTYETTRIDVLEAETHITPMKLHLNQLQDMQKADFLQYIQTSVSSRVVSIDRVGGFSTHLFVVGEGILV